MQSILVLIAVISPILGVNPQSPNLVILPQGIVMPTIEDCQEGKEEISKQLAQHLHRNAPEDVKGKVNIRIYAHCDILATTSL